MGLKPKDKYETIAMNFPDDPKDDGQISVSFTLDVHNDTAIAMSGGVVHKGLDYIGSFDGLVGFAHNAEGPDKPAVDAVLHDLSEALTEEYNVPPVPEYPEPAPEGSGSGDGEENNNNSGEGE
jgi:hypothetical protein